MRFSVVVPTYNRARLLERCLGALMAQTYPDYEVILVDDGSSDDTAAVVRCFSQVRYLRQQNRGPAAARNLGVAHANGEVIAFTDDDCLVPQDWLDRLAGGYQSHPHVGGVGGYMEAPDEVLAKNVFAKYERYVSEKRYKVGPRQYVGGFECPAGGTNNMSYRRAVLEAVGGFDESFPVAAGEDADLKWRICQQGHCLLYLPVKVTHLQSYSVRSFLRQSFRQGIGAVYFERKHGRGPGRVKVALRLFKRLLAFCLDLAVMRPRRLALVKLVNGAVVCMGEWVASGGAK